ncbi:hypothetical protein OHB14_59585 [Streptomyces sp. NBC_01613]
MFRGTTRVPRTHASVRSGSVLAFVNFETADHLRNEYQVTAARLLAT